MLNFGLIGCGRIAKKHAELLGENQIAGAKLAAVCDIKPERAKFYADKYGVLSFTNMHEMMSKADLDVVCILTPSGDHANHTNEIAPYKKHIVVEKPMALRLRDADKMNRVCDENGVRLFVVKQNRFNQPVIALRKALTEGRFGKLVLGTVRVRWARDQKYYDQDPWRGTWAQDGGVFTNQASHHIDLLVWMMGDVESVYAKSTTALVNIETEDTGVVVVKFVNGALGVIEATTACRPKDLEGSLSILGEKGTVEISGFAVNEIRHWNFTETQCEDNKIKELHSVQPPTVYGFGHKNYLEHVVDCIKSNRAMLVDGLEGRKSLEVIHAIYESIETQKEVTIHFQPTHCRLGQK